MADQLSYGALEIIMSGGFYQKPVVQVLSRKRVKGSNDHDRFRLWLSDGKNFYDSTILDPDLSEKIISGELSDYSIIQIDDFVTSTSPSKFNGNKILTMLIKALTIVASGTEVGTKLGDPQILLPKLTTIANLSPNKNKWVIKARVLNKSDKIPFRNGNGVYFNVHLCDESGEIKATAFNRECDKFYDTIEINKVYCISNCCIKSANKQFNNLKNDNEIIFETNTVIVESMDDTPTIPNVTYDFVPITDIASKCTDSTLDVIGICIRASEINELTPRKTGNLIQMREVTIADQSGAAINLTLWRNEAVNFDATTNPVIAVKGARLAEFNGSKSLSCLGSTMLRTNPDLPEAHRLRGWYDHGGASAELVNISARESYSSAANSEWLTFLDVEARKLGTDGKSYYNLLGVLTCIFTDKAVYKACPQNMCNRKLVEQDNGCYRCEKCDREYTNYKHRLLLSARVEDPTGARVVTAFNDVAERVLGAGAGRVARLRGADPPAFVRLFDAVLYKTFLFTFRNEMGTFNNEKRMNTTVMSAHPINYKDAIARCVTSIKALSGVQLT